MADPISVSGPLGLQEGQPASVRGARGREREREKKKINKEGMRSLQEAGRTITRAHFIQCPDCPLHQPTVHILVDELVASRNNPRIPYPKCSMEERAEYQSFVCNQVVAKQFATRAPQA